MPAAPSSISAFLPPDIMLASRRRKSTVSDFSLGGSEKAVADIDMRDRLEFNFQLERTNLLNMGPICHCNDAKPNTSLYRYKSWSSHCDGLNLCIPAIHLLAAFRPIRPRWVKLNPAEYFRP